MMQKVRESEKISKAAVASKTCSEHRRFAEKVMCKSHKAHKSRLSLYMFHAVRDPSVRHKMELIANLVLHKMALRPPIIGFVEEVDDIVV